MRPVIDHIHITVSDLTRAEKFYDKLLPILGFDFNNKEYDIVPEHEYRSIEYHDRNFSFGIVCPRREHADEKVSRRKPGAIHHLAFRAASREAVDKAYKKVLEIPAKIVHAPQYYPEYCEDYYAFFFKDSEGIEYEIVSFDRKKYFGKEVEYSEEIL